MNTTRLTKMLVLGGGLFDQAEEELREVADDDEGRGQCRTAVVLHDQVVPLELPEDVCVALHHLEGVAARERSNKDVNVSPCLERTRARVSVRRAFPHLNMAMSRLSSRTLVTRRKMTSSRMTSQLA